MDFFSFFPVFIFLIFELFEWNEIIELEVKKKETQSRYVDTEASATQTARCKVVAVDLNANISEPSVSVEVKAFNSDKSQVLKKLNKQVDYEKGQLLIYWEKPIKEVMHYKVYRKTQTKAYALYETIEGTQNNFQDYNLKLGDYCAYRIKVIYKDGSVSGFSKEIEVQF